jgi:hypothetical protein
MNYEINEYDSRQDLIEEGFNNTINDFEEEYEFQNNNILFNNNNGGIDSFIPPERISNKINKYYNNQNSFSNMSNNNISPYEDQNNSKVINNYNFVDKKKSNQSSNILNMFDKYNNKYINDNHSITLLNLTDKIYEDDEHFKKGIITKKNETKGNFKKLEYKKKKASKFRYNNNDKNNRKSLFLMSSKNNKGNNNIRKSGNIKKRRTSCKVQQNKDKSHHDIFNKPNLKKNNEALVKEADDINECPNNIDDKKNKIKIVKNKTIKAVESNCNINENPLLKNKKSKMAKTNKKYKAPLEEVANEEKEDKNILKKNIKNEKIDNEKIIVTETNENKKSQESNKKNKKKKKYCLLCCLNYNSEDSNDTSNKKNSQ